MKKVLERAHAKEIQKVLNREGFTGNRLFYKRVREETADESSGNHNALAIKDALIAEKLVKMPDVPLEALVMSSILRKWDVKAITPEIEAHIKACGFKKRSEKGKVYYTRPYTGGIYSRYEEIPSATKDLKIPVKGKKQTLTADQVRAKFKVARINKTQVATLERDGFKKVVAEKAPHAVTFVRENKAKKKSA